MSALPAASLAAEDTRTVIDALIEEQRDLSAVEKFSRLHEQNRLPSEAAFYQDLLPLSRPRVGEQYAFAVNLDACTGCKACVSACHSMNGLDAGESWRDVGLLLAVEESPAWQQTVTTACHHCADPACANGCPVLAYEKDAETGIVRHLDDQCIGCQYCQLKCPYDVPKYSKRLGIVRKCDMCHGRLTAGEAPACVQACPNEAIRIEVVASSAPGEALVPGAFRSDYTRPTTRYRSSRPYPNGVMAAQHGTRRSEPAHWPLIGMLLLTQCAAGLHWVNAWIPSPQLAWAAAIILHAGLAVSVLHLGRPLKAWRAFLGWRKSWMSREILAFGCYAAASMVALLPGAQAIGAIVAAGIAAIAIFCSAMIYIDTRRPGWRASVVLPKFFGTAVLLGFLTAGVLNNPFFGGWAALVLCSGLSLWERYRFFTKITAPRMPGV